ncbi:unnamed protein product [Arabidopsis halleri]
MPQAQLIKRIDKNVRNRLSSIPTGGFEEGLQLWFASRT